MRRAEEVEAAWELAWEEARDRLEAEHERATEQQSEIEGLRARVCELEAEIRVLRLAARRVAAAVRAALTDGVGA